MVSAVGGVVVVEKVTSPATELKVASSWNNLKPAPNAAGSGFDWYCVNTQAFGRSSSWWIWKDPDCISLTNVTPFNTPLPNV